MSYRDNQAPAYSAQINNHAIDFYAEPNGMASDPFVPVEQFLVAIGAADQRYEIFDRKHAVPTECLRFLATDKGKLAVVAAGGAVIVVLLMIREGRCPYAALPEFQAAVSDANSAIKARALA
jgi:hypothetical protein